MTPEQLARKFEEIRAAREQARLAMQARRERERTFRYRPSGQLANHTYCECGEIEGSGACCTSEATPNRAQTHNDQGGGSRV